MGIQEICAGTESKSANASAVDSLILRNLDRFEQQKSNKKLSDSEVSYNKHLTQVDQRPLKAGARVRVPYALPSDEVQRGVDILLGKQLLERFRPKPRDLEK